MLDAKAAWAIYSTPTVVFPNHSNFGSKCKLVNEEYSRLDRHADFVKAADAYQAWQEGTA